MRRVLVAAWALGTAVSPIQHASAAEKGEELHFVTMEPISVPIVETGRIQGMLNFKLVLDAADAEAANRATGDLPRLRAATLAAALEFARLRASTLMAIDARQLDIDLTAAIRPVEPGITRVLIVEVSAQRS